MYTHMYIYIYKYIYTFIRVRLIYFTFSVPRLFFFFFMKYAFYTSENSIKNKKYLMIFVKIQSSYFAS